MYVSVYVCVCVYVFMCVTAVNMVLVIATGRAAQHWSIM